MEFTTKNTKLECYSINFGSGFAALVRRDGSPLFLTGITMDDAALVTHTPNGYDDGLELTSVSDAIWIDANKVRRIVGCTTHQALVDYANGLAAKYPTLMSTQTDQ